MLTMYKGESYQRDLGLMDYSDGYEAALGACRGK